MNDFDYDVMQKKRIAAGAFHKKNGSKSKGCRLPSDNLTAAQKAKLNGEVKTVNFNRPMKYDEFKALSNDEKGLYLDALRAKYDATPAMVASMFGVSQRMVAVWCETVNVWLERNGRGTHTPKEVLERWDKFVRGETGEAKVEERVEEKPVETVKEATLVESPFYCNKGTFNVYCNPAELMQMLTVICGSGRKAYTISFGDAE